MPLLRLSGVIVNVTIVNCTRSNSNSQLQRRPIQCHRGSYLVFHPSVGFPPFCPTTNTTTKDPVHCTVKHIKCAVHCTQTLQHGKHGKQTHKAHKMCCELHANIASATVCWQLQCWQTLSSAHRHIFKMHFKPCVCVFVFELFRYMLILYGWFGKSNFTTISLAYLWLLSFRSANF